MTISLRGYIFFGSAVQILEDVKSRLLITTPESQMEPSLNVSEGEQVASNTDEDDDIETAASLSSRAANTKSFSHAMRGSKAANESSDPLLKKPSGDEHASHSLKKKKPALLSFPVKVAVSQQTTDSTLELKMVPIPSNPTPAHANSNAVGLPRSSSNDRVLSLTSSPIAQSSSLTHAHLQSVYDLSEVDIVRHNEKWVNKTTAISYTNASSSSTTNGTSIRLSPHSILTGAASSFQPTSPKPVHLTGPSMLSLSLSAAKKADEAKKEDVTTHEHLPDAKKKAAPAGRDKSDDSRNIPNDDKVSRKESWFLEDPINVLPASNSSLNMHESLYKNPHVSDSSSMLAVIWESQVQRRDKDKEMLQSLLSRQDMGSLSSYGSVNCTHSPSANTSNIRVKSQSFSAADPSFKDIDSMPLRNSNSNNFNSISNSMNAPTNRPKGIS